jgi:phosphoribosyl-AMP cyclohydrolase
MQIDFYKMDGLAPAIVQEDSTGEVLMVGFMNAEALNRTVQTGYVTFYSRSRQTLWMKGETSGNRLQQIAPAVVTLAEAEGLKAHVESIRVRCNCA